MKYVFRERGITIYPPYKKLRPRNFAKGQIEHKGDKGEIIGLKSQNRVKVNTRRNRINNARSNTGLMKKDNYKIWGSDYHDILKIPSLDTGLHIQLHHLISLLSGCNLGLYPDLL